MIILLPLGGQGERFKKHNYTLPKPLIKVLGKPIIFWLLDSLQFQKDTIICIPYHKSLYKYRFESLLNKQYPHLNFLFKSLESNTNGAVETIFYGLNELHKLNYTDSNILCLDCDNFYNDYDIIKEWNKMNQVFVVNDETSRTCFSFVTFDENTNQIINFEEKQRISNFACTGAYGFESWKLLYDNLINKEMKQRNEYYISLLISEMVMSKNFSFHVNVIKRNHWICLGTPLDLIHFNERNDISSETKTYCFELDNTLVTFPYVIDDYSTVRPIQNNINLLRLIRSRGNKIIIYTSRGMKTYNNNVGKITANISNITMRTLENFEIPYDELYFGKPHADFYIDDSAVSAFQDIEKELGFYNRKLMMRHFNNIEINNTIDIYRKSSHNLESEIFYYKNIPSCIREYFPALIKWDVNSKWYDMEKIKGLTISKLFLSYQLSEPLLLKILDKLDLIHNCIEVNSSISIYDNYLKKMKQRYDKNSYTRFENTEAYYKRICIELSEYEKNDLGKAGVIHGDPVLTNILIDSEDNIKFIDMKGMLGATNTIYGDVMYDWAKIYQSLIGYDEIQEDIELEVEYKKPLIVAFEKYVVNKMNSTNILKHIKTITKSLLFTLLPLHSDISKCNQYYNLMQTIS